MRSSVINRVDQKYLLGDVVLAELTIVLSILQAAVSPKDFKREFNEGKLDKMTFLMGIKIDVESHEFKVLEGLKKIININKCIIQIEICKKNYSKVNNFLILNKYRLIKAINERSNYFYKNFD